VTSPDEDTVATAALLVAQVTVRPEIACPLASRTEACAWAVWPTGTVVTPDTTTELTTASVTVNGAEPLCPSLVAMMFALPTATAETAPVAETVAIEGADEDQVMARPTRTLPPASRSVAVAVVDWPVVMLGRASVTATVATGATVVVVSPEEPPQAPVIAAARTAREEILQRLLKVRS
jgi:hypothetical protein